MDRSIAGLRWFGVGLLLLLTCGRSAAQCGPSSTCPTVTVVDLYDIPNIPNTTIPLFFGGEGAGIALDPTNQLLYFGENPFGQGFAAVVQLDLTGKQGPVILQSPGGFGDVTALTFHAGKLYVADGNGYQNPNAAGQPTALNVIWLYDPANTATNGGWSQIVTGVNDPTGLAIDAAQNLYVSSWTDRTVYKYPYDTSSGLYDLARVTLWTAPDPTAAPYGLAFDQVGNLYIAGFGGGPASTGTKIFKVDLSGNSSIFFDAQAADPQSIYFNDGGSWQVPAALAFDTHGYLYASYYDSLKIVRIAPDGSFIVVPGGGTGDDAANGVAISPQGDLFTVVNGGRTTTSPAVLKIDGLVPVPPAVLLSVPQPTEVYQSTFLVSAATNASTIPTITATGVCTISGNTVTMISGTGTCTLTANWPGDTNYLAATTTQTITAASAVSITGLNSSFNPSVLGQSVSFTAVVSSAIPGTLSGSVTFYDGGTALGSSPLSGTQASLTTSVLSLGTHSITASYSGDANYTGSTSAVLVQTIASSLPSVVVVTVNEMIRTTESESFPDIADSEAIKVSDMATVTPLIKVAAPVVSYSPGSLGFGSVPAGQTAVQSLSVSDIGQAALTISSAVLAQGSAFAISQIACSNGATSLPTTLTVGGACTFALSYSAPTGTAATAIMTFTDNAALSNLPTTPSGSSYTQSISLTGSGTSAPPPPPPPSVITVTDNEMIAVSEVESFPDIATSESIKVSDAVTVSVSNTSAGTNVVVTPVDSTTKTSPVTVTFAAVSQVGNTSLTTTSFGPALPIGFTAGSPVIYYNLSTTAVYSGLITISIDFTGTTFTTTPHLLHYDSVATAWTDITTLVSGSIIRGSVSSLSPFVVAEETPTLPTVTTNPASQTVTAGSNVTFTAAGSGKPSPSAQWQVSTNGGASYTNVAGATSTTLTLTGVTASQNGYLYEAVFTNSVGSATTSAATLTVNSAPGITANPVGQTVTAGSVATFTAAASGNPTPTIQWQVSTNGGTSYTAIAGATSTTLTLIAVTTSQNGYLYQAVFTNSVGSAATSVAVLTVTSTSTATSTVVTASPNPVITTQSVTFTATVTSASGTPTGSVSFSYQPVISGGASGSLGTVTLVSGTASVTVSGAALPLGSNIITATYAGSGNFNPSSGTVGEQVLSTYATTTTVTSSANPALNAQTVVFTAAVSSVSGTPTGTVTFTYKSTIAGSATRSLGTTALSSGVASVSVLASSLPRSTTISASYGGSTAFSASTGSMIEQVVAAYPTTTAVTATPSPVLTSESLTLTASVTSADGTPTGNLTFSYVVSGSGSLSTALGTAPLSSGVASLTIAATSLPTGTIKITANYGGVANTWAASSGSVSEQEFAAFPTKTVVTASPSPVLTSGNMTLTATATSAYGTPTGAVSFSYTMPVAGAATTSLGTATLASGVATLTVAASSLPTGTLKIAAAYGGVANTWVASSGSVSEQVVSAASPTTTTVTASPSPAVASQSVTLTATVSASGTPTGNVTFSYSMPVAGSVTTSLGTAALASGVATLTVAASSLPTGTLKITAAYGGLANTWVASSGSVSEHVFAAFPTKIAVAASPSPVLTSGNMTLTATVTSAYGTPTGAVSFSYTMPVAGAATTSLGTAALASGVATLTVTASSLPTGTLKIAAAYGGVANTFGTSSGSVSEQVLVTFPTKTTVAATPNPATTGQNVTLAASVTSADGTPTGSVTFYSRSSAAGGKTVSIGSVTISSGVAILTVPVSSLPLGTDTITAKYGGSSSFSASQGAALETVD